MNTTVKILRDQKGQAILIGAVALFALLAVSGLAIDLGRMFVVRAELNKAVDGAALAGASVLPGGEQRAKQAALEYAEMNFRPGYMNTSGHRFSVTFNRVGEQKRVAVSGRAIMETTFLRLVGLRVVRVPAQAEAERRPLSVALVLDNSQSLRADFSGTDGIGYLKTASSRFVGNFDDDLDEVALTLFATGAEVRFPLGHRFMATVQSHIQSMTADEWTNTNLADGFMGGYHELKSDDDRGSLRVLVFFTDGRPTALRDVYPVDGRDYDAVIKGGQNPSSSVEPELFRPDRLREPISGNPLYTRDVFPNGMPKDVPTLQMLATQNTLAAANAARDEGIVIYTIGLGNPNASQWYKQPDAELLIEMANAPDGYDPRDGGTYVNPNYNPDQPRGEYYFAPDATQLSTVFDQVAREIVLRLTR